MVQAACPGCLVHQAQIAEFERRFSSLEARQGANSSNSSIPPSANPLDDLSPFLHFVLRRKGEMG